MVSKPQLPAADLTVKPKPIMPEAAITDDAENARYNSAVEAWGEDGWMTVARICRWAAANNMAHPQCPSVAP